MVINSTIVWEALHDHFKCQFVGDTSHLLQWLLSKRQGITNVGEDVEKVEPSYSFGGTVNLCSHYGKQNGHSSKN